MTRGPAVTSNTVEVGAIRTPSTSPHLPAAPDEARDPDPEGADAVGF